ncbi:MAG: amidohydrolase family protein [Microthrixaceae bacterium]
MEDQGRRGTRLVDAGGPAGHYGLDGHRAAAHLPPGRTGGTRLVRPPECSRRAPGVQRRRPQVDRGGQGSPPPHRPVEPDHDRGRHRRGRTCGGRWRASRVHPGRHRAGRPLPRRSRGRPALGVVAEANVPVTLHIGGQGGFFGSDAWPEAELLRPGSFSTGEPVGPHMLATMQLSPQNYLASMLYGGVFDRHPALRVGVIELGAMWVGPFVDLLEDRVQLSRRLRDSLQRLPTEVFVDQIRVTPFFWERTARQIERYGMPEVYAFSTDFPHPEGGTDPIGRMAADIEPLGTEAIEAFFVGNAELLLPA